MWRTKQLLLGRYGGYGVSLGHAGVFLIMVVEFAEIGESCRSSKHPILMDSHTKFH